MADKAKKQAKTSKNIKVFIRIRPLNEKESQFEQCVRPIDEE